MAAHVFVLSVDGRGERSHDAREEFRLLVVERDVAGVDAQDGGHARHETGFDRAKLDFAVGDFGRAGVIQY